MTAVSYGTSLYIAGAALEMITFFVLAVVCVLQFCFVRRHGDAARNWVKWSRWSLATFTFTVFVFAADLVIATVYNRFLDRGIEFFASEQIGISQARGFLDSIWWLGEAVSRVLLLATLVMLAAGIAMARSPGAAAQPGWAKMPSLAWGAGFLTLGLAFAVFGVRCYFWAHVFDNRRQNFIYDRSLRNHNSGGVVDFDMINRVTIDMDFALHCIWLFLSLVVLVLAIRTKTLSRSAPQTKSASNSLLFCAILFVVHPLYNVIVFILFNLGLHLANDFGPTIVTDVVIRSWSYGLILLRLFVLGRQKVGGVWSTAQPFQTKDAVAGETVYQTPWGYQVTRQTSPPPDSSNDAQAQLNNYYAQPQHGAQATQYSQQQQPHYG